MKNKLPLLSMLSNKLANYSRIKPTTLTMQDYFDFCKISRENSFEFTRRELLVRFANLLQDCAQSDRKRFFDMPSARQITDANWDSFESLVQFENVSSTIAKMERFNDELRTISKRYRSVVAIISKSICELYQAYGINASFSNESVSLHAGIDSLLMKNLAIRTLMNQYLATFGAFEQLGAQLRVQRFNGVIDATCDVTKLIRDAYATARDLCEEYYQRVPPLEIHKPDESVFITTESSYLYHIVFEIVKNAMRATVEQHNCPATELPPIKISIHTSYDELVIKICDQGGGIPATIAKSLFNYTYSTCGPHDGTTTPFAGFGTGLPVSRIYARYFSGDLRLSSTEGFGTDACIYVKADPIKAIESLPGATWKEYRRHEIVSQPHFVPDSLLRTTACLA